jgi:hypothetical protein
MSRGLGTFHREILDTLVDAKRHQEHYRGFGGEPPRPLDGLSDYAKRWQRPGWVVAGRNTVRLGMNVYDLRASCDFLARRHKKKDALNGIDATFKTAFSRAAAGLPRRGLLVRYERLVPLAEVDENRIGCLHTIHDLADGLYLACEFSQTRFVYRGQQ